MFVDASILLSALSDLKKNLLESSYTPKENSYFLFTQQAKLGHKIILHNVYGYVDLDDIHCPPFFRTSPVDFVILTSRELRIPLDDFFDPKGFIFGSMHCPSVEILGRYILLELQNLIIRANNCHKIVRLSVPFGNQIYLKPELKRFTNVSEERQFQNSSQNEESNLETRLIIKLLKKKLRLVLFEYVQ